MTRRKGLFVYQKGKCYYCDIQMDMDLTDGPLMCTIDHKKPLSKGGRKIKGNEVAACKHCNGLKGDMTADEFFVFMGTDTYKKSQEAVSARRVARRELKAKRAASLADNPASVKRAMVRPPADLGRVYCASVESVFADVLAEARAKLFDEKGA